MPGTFSLPTTTYPSPKFYTNFFPTTSGDGRWWWWWLVVWRAGTCHLPRCLPAFNLLLPYAPMPALPACLCRHARKLVGVLCWTGGMHCIPPVPLAPSAFPTPLWFTGTGVGWFGFLPCELCLTCAPCIAPTPYPLPLTPYPGALYLPSPCLPMPPYLTTFFPSAFCFLPTLPCFHHPHRNSVPARWWWWWLVER